MVLDSKKFKVHLASNKEQTSPLFDIIGPSNHVGEPLDQHPCVW